MNVESTSTDPQESNNEKITPDLQTTSQVELRIIPNATSLGAGQAVEVNITVENTDDETVYGVNLTLSTDGFDNETEVENLTLSIGTLNAFESNSSKLQFSFPSYDDIDFVGDAIDLVFVIDSSGSMGSEITAIKTQLNSLLTNLTDSYHDVRVGAVVYGSKIYSEYPADDPRNYLPLSNDFIAVSEFIDDLRAYGGEEPWGDALWVANNFSWRLQSPVVKMIVIVGDEDCDPGKLVGVGVLGGYYNGSELLAVVDSLKQKNVKVYSVVTEDPHENVADQFRWISEYTEGKTFSLDEGGLTADDLPQLINAWALNQTHEMVVEITGTIEWHSPIFGFQKTNTTEIIWIDLTAPDISISSSVPFTMEDSVSYQVFAYVNDVSSITAVTGYWKTTGLWNFTSLEKVGKSIYKLELPKYPFGSVVQCYINAQDSCGNDGSTEIMNITIAYPTVSNGSIMRIYSINDSLAYKLNLESSADYVVWITSINGTTEPSLYSTSKIFTPTSTSSENNTKTLVWRQKLSGPDLLKIDAVPEGLNESVFIKISLAAIKTLDITKYMLNLQDFYLNETIQVHTFKINVTLSEKDDNKTLSLYFPEYSDLIAKIRVYNENWSLSEGIVDESGFWAAFDTNGIYYLRIDRVFRTGVYSFTGDIVGYDPYRQYYDAEGAADDASLPHIALFFTFFTLIALSRTYRRKKNQNNV